MSNKTPVSRQPGIRQLLFRLPVHIAAAHRGVVAELAVVLIRRPDELTLDDHVAQIAEDLSHCRGCRSRDHHALLATLMTREVIRACRDRRGLVLSLEQ